MIAMLYPVNQLLTAKSVNNEFAKIPIAGIFLSRIWKPGIQEI